MIEATRDITEFTGRPKQAGTPVLVRVQPDQLAALDRWIEAQRKPKPSRPQAIRELVRKALAEK